jgi:PilZ domain-containing protein
MEHRWNPRVTVAARVMTYDPQYGASVGMARDVSAGGMLVELDNGICPLNAPVTLLLRLDDLDGPVLRLPAMVARVDGNEIGLMFLEYNDQTALALHEWIEASHVEPNTRTTADIVIFPIAATKRSAERRTHPAKSSFSSDLQEMS